MLLNVMYNHCGLSLPFTLFRFGNSTFSWAVALFAGSMITESLVLFGISTVVDTVLSGSFVESNFLEFSCTIKVESILS